MLRFENPGILNSKEILECTYETDRDCLSLDTKKFSQKSKVLITNMFLLKTLFSH